MDMAMVDVSGIACREGDEAIVFGPQHPLADHARDLGTIPYEALTSISQRVKRVYVHGQAGRATADRHDRAIVRQVSKRGQRWPSPGRHPDALRP